MTCEKCKDVVDVDPKAGPYITQVCSGCGRNMMIRRPGKHGIGIEIRAGEKFTIPAGWITIAANPLKGNGHLTRHGLHYFSSKVFSGDINKREADFDAALAESVASYGEELEKIALSFDLDPDCEDTKDRLFKLLDADHTHSGWWLALAQFATTQVQKNIDVGDARLAAWYMAIAERFRSIHIFKEHFEEVVYMGHSAKRLTDLLALWNKNHDNSDEEFWQIQFHDHPLAVSQIFASPVTFIKEKAYVGGQQVDNKSAQLVDFLFSGGASDEAILVEIKTPTKHLLQKRQYRSGLHAPSTELSGGIVQVSNYRRTIMESLRDIIKYTDYKIEAVRPRAVVIIGRSDELDTQDKRRSFELFRTSLADVEIITFDELFRKLEYLAYVFNLVKKAKQ
jgi:hypothetical protein